MSKAEQKNSFLRAAQRKAVELVNTQKQLTNGTEFPSHRFSGTEVPLISRRRTMKSIAVLGASGLLRLSSRELAAAPITGDTVDCLRSKKYRLDLREKAGVSINAFLDDDDTAALIDLWTHSAVFTRQSMGVYRPGPIYQFVNPAGTMSLEAIGSDSTQTFLHLAKSWDNTQYFPNLTSIDVMKQLDDPEVNGPIWDGNLVYLGREPKLMHATMGGKKVDLIVDIFYGGCFCLLKEPSEDSPAKLKKYVLPFFNIWRAEDVSQDSPMPLTIYSAGTRNPQFPFPVSEILPSSSQLPKIEGLERSAVAGVGINYSKTVTQQMCDGAISEGRPEELYTPDLWNAATQNAIDLYARLRDDALKYANANDYCLWAYSPGPEPISIADVYDLSTESQGKLPSWKSILEKDTVKTADLAKILCGDLLTINPRSAANS